MKSLGIDSTRVEASVRSLIAGGHQLVAGVTGAGAGLSKLIWEVPGVSATLNSVSLVYAQGAFDDYVGEESVKYCSQEGALKLANASYLQLQRLVARRGKPLAPGAKIVGLGLSAAVQTSRTRRGDDQIFLAARSQDRLIVSHAKLVKIDDGRKKQGELCDLLGLNTVLRACGLEEVPVNRADFVETETSDEILPPSLGPITESTLFRSDGTVDRFVPGMLNRKKHFVLPGSFHPLHFGHLEMARVGRRVMGREPVYEISLNNVAKVAPSPEDIAKRIWQFRGLADVIVSPDTPRFVQKIERYGTDFVIGLDTAVRILDPIFLPAGMSMEQLIAFLRSTKTKAYTIERDMTKGDPDKEEEDPAAPLLPYPDIFRLLPPVGQISSTELRDLGLG